MKNLLRSKKFHSALGIVCSIGALVWVFTTIDMSKVLDELKNANYWALIPLTLINVIQYVVRTLRWRYLLPETRDGQEAPSLGSLWDAMMLGNLATYLLPLRAGEFIRPYVLSLRSKVAFSTGFVSVVLERFLDLSLVLFSFGLVSVFVNNLPVQAMHGALSLSVVAVAILVGMVLAVFIPDKLMALADFFLRVFPAALRPKLRGFAEGFLQGVAVLGSVRRVGITVFLTILVWLSTFYYYQVCFSAVGIVPTFWSGTLLGVLLALAVAAPSAPGFAGIFEGACMASFALLGLDQNRAVAYALITHAHQYIFIIFFGVLALLRQNLSFAQLRQARTSSAEA